MIWGFCVYFVYMIPLETDVLRKHRFQKTKFSMGAQWLNIRVFDPRPIQAVASSSITGVTVLCPLARHINPCLVLVKPRTTRPDITEKMFSWT